MNQLMYRICQFYCAEHITCATSSSRKQMPIATSEQTATLQTGPAETARTQTHMTAACSCMSMDCVPKRPPFTSMQEFQMLPKPIVMYRQESTSSNALWPVKLLNTNAVTALHLLCAIGRLAAQPCATSCNMFIKCWLVALLEKEHRCSDWPCWQRDSSVFSGAEKAENAHDVAPLCHMGAAQQGMRQPCQKQHQCQ